jgi:peptidyl-tRNA hydrolase
VLSKFPASEREIVERAVNRAADAVETFVSDGLQVAMNRFNVTDDNGGDSAIDTK